MKTILLLIATISIISLTALWAAKNIPKLSSQGPKTVSPDEEKPSIIKDLTPENANPIITSLPLVVIDFYAEWCGPCKTLKPIFEEIAHELGNKYVFAKVNIDVCKDVAAQYSITSIPTVAIFSNGKLLAKVTGLTTKKTLLETIETAVKGPQDLSKLSQDELNEKLFQSIYTMATTDEVKRLLDAGADANYTTKDGITPLMITIMNYGARGTDATDAIKLLLEAGANTEFTGVNGQKSKATDIISQMAGNMRLLATNYDKMATAIEGYSQEKN